MFDRLIVGLCTAIMVKRTNPTNPPRTDAPFMDLGSNTPKHAVNSTAVINILLSIVNNFLSNWCKI